MFWGFFDWHDYVCDFYTYTTALVNRYYVEIVMSLKYAQISNIPLPTLYIQFPLIHTYKHWSELIKLNSGIIIFYFLFIIF